MVRLDEIRNRILDVAQKVFSHFGFDKTTMELIAKESNKGKSTLYYYFRNKEELYAAVIEREANKIMNELMKVINSDDSTKNLLYKYSKKRFELVQSVVTYYDFVKDEYLKYYPFIEKHRKKHDEFEIYAMKQILLKGIQRDELNITEEQVDDVAIGIGAAIKGLELPLLIESTNNTIERKIAILLDLFLYGLLKNKD